MSFLFSGQQQAILAFCANECERQKASPVEVLHMLDAYEYAMNWIVGIPGQRLTSTGISAIHSKLMPSKVGYRIGPAVFDQGGVALAPEFIGRQVDLLVDNQRKLEPMEFVHRFLEIHPYRDGNGRTAAILFNLLQGTMLLPEPLPEMSFV